ncbi:LON peptidase substrate-binding domain-containing protein [Alienimonas sp. DA493]|uniref:LON peptidase substrate-binding domain-containing protein n=1 Tax=Alienimonas sp. DA493 TaxID=3373605 RepID=UPI003754C70F
MTPPEHPPDDDPRPGDDPSGRGRDDGADGAGAEEDDDCGVPEPVAPHATKGPERLPRNFSGKVPLFPLPGCVFFPHTLLPLHIFEPRYRAMTRDALGLERRDEPGEPPGADRRGERLIAMARLREGFDTELPHGEEFVTESDRPPIHDTVCLGKIVAEQELPDGRFHIVLRGVVRAAVKSERITDAGYRLAAVAPLPDRCGARPDLDRPARTRQITDAFVGLYPDVDLPDVLARAFGRCVTPGMVCDVVASVLQLSPDDSQELLDQTDPDVRTDVVLRHLRRHLVKAGFKTGRTGLADPQWN